MKIGGQATTDLRKRRGDGAFIKAPPLFAIAIPLKVSDMTSPTGFEPVLPT